MSSSKPRKIAFIVDPLPKLKLEKDSTIAMMAVAAARGHRLYACEQGQISLSQGRVLGDFVELTLTGDQDDALRPTLRMRRGREGVHGAFPGFNRAQAAVIEGAVLVSRLHMLPMDKIESEMNYLQIAIDKTAGVAEHEAWGWLREAVQAHRAKLQAQSQGTM